MMRPEEEQLAARLAALETLPNMTKTRLKAIVFADHSIDWAALRRAELRPRSPNWKTELVTRLLTRHFAHGGARRRQPPRTPAGLTNDDHVEPPGAMVEAVIQLVQSLPKAVRADLLRRLAPSQEAGARAPRPPTVTPMADDLLRRRHILHWHNMECFTVRLLRRLGPGPLSPEDISGVCERTHAWWLAEGRMQSHFRLRQANRLTAGLQLVYTHLPACHEVHDRVAAVVLQPCCAPAVAPISPPLSVHRLWRSFTRRFPVLGVYQTVWDPDRAGQILSAPVICSGPPSASFASRAEEAGWPPELVERDAGIRLLAELLQPQLPWAQWGREGYNQLAWRVLTEAGSLLHGFGANASAVVQAVRMVDRTMRLSPSEPAGAPSSPAAAPAPAPP